MTATLTSNLADTQESSGHSGMIRREKIAASFARAAREYDTYAVLQREVADTLLAYLPASIAPLRVLDLGCGTGYCTRALQHRYPDSHVYALDLAFPMLVQTRRQGINPSLAICADAACLPFNRESLDLVLGSLSLQWCGEPETVFAELGRVLSPGGKALLSTFGPGSLQELRQAWAQVDNYTHVNIFDSARRLQQAAAISGLTLDLKVQSLVRWYPDLLCISRELKGIGAHNMNDNQAPGLTGRQAFRLAERQFARAGQPGKGIPVSYEIYYLEMTRPL